MLFSETNPDGFRRSHVANRPRFKTFLAISGSIKPQNEENLNPDLTRPNARETQQKPSFNPEKHRPNPGESQTVKVPGRASTVEFLIDECPRRARADRTACD